MGSEASVQSLAASDLKAFHQKFARPNNAVLAISGDIHPGNGSCRGPKGIPQLGTGV